MDKKQLGLELKLRRKELRLSQKECAAGICSQPLLSHIEVGDYMPAADILLELFERLGMTERQFTLKNYFPMSDKKSLNKKCEMLCRNHEYAELLNFLLQDEVIDTVRDSESQAYYYYLAVAQFQTGATMSAEQSFNLALAEQEKLNVISRLSLASLGVLYAQSRQPKMMQASLSQAFDGLAEFDELESAQYDENLNALFYLKAYSQKLLNDPLAALLTLESGVKAIARHNSHYMLANFYYLAARLSNDDKTRYFANSQLFAGLYQEKIFDKI